MRRLLPLSPLFLLLAGGLLVADDGKARPADKPAPKKADATALDADVDEFIKEHDRNKDGFLTRDEIPERFRHHFERLDADKDRKISREELRKSFHQLRVRRRPSDVVFVLVEMTDFDDAAAAELQRIYDVLHKLDRNKDGKLDASELEEGRKALVKARVDRLFTELDKNKDGKISRDEARGLLRSHFDQLDANKDGFIDRDELTRAAAERPGKVVPKERPKER